MIYHSLSKLYAITYDLSFINYTQRNAGMVSATLTTKFNKMNRTKEKLLLECIKQFEHIENVLGYNRLSTTRSLINEINQALTIPDVVVPKGTLCDKCTELWGITDAEDRSKYSCDCIK